MQISENELIKRLMIHDASFLSSSEKILLEKNLDSWTSLAVMSINDISLAVGRDVSRGEWNGEKSLEKARFSKKILDALEISCTFFDQDDFPPMLKEMKDFPYGIFYRGDINCLNANCVSAVGTRNATNSGKRSAFEFAKDACDAGWTVVSGLAFGIDVFSHRGALEGTRGKTAAVLPCGIDAVVPSAHKSVAAKILKSGGVLLSEYAPKTPTQKFRFVQRNRIIAALSPATVVIQAPSGSGAMITADFALGYNRYVFFHQACFDEEGALLQKKVERQLKIAVESGKISSRSAENRLNASPRRYVEDGACVIKNFAEYCLEFQQELCEKNIKTDRQTDLFAKKDF